MKNTRLNNRKIKDLRQDLIGKVWTGYGMIVDVQWCKVDRTYTLLMADNNTFYIDEFFTR